MMRRIGEVGRRREVSAVILVAGVNYFFFLQLFQTKFKAVILVAGVNYSLNFDHIFFICPAEVPAADILDRYLHKI